MRLAKRFREWRARRRRPLTPVATDETTIIDWGGDMSACLAYIRAHPCPAKLAGVPHPRPKYPDDGRSVDQMFGGSYAGRPDFAASRRRRRR